MAEPRIVDDRDHGRLTAFEGETPVGVIVYFALADDPHALVAVHTVVETAHEGKGIAGALVREFYALAAADGVPVVPLCPYAARWAERHPDEAPAAPPEVVRAAKRQLKERPELW
ncbi:MULTISPECIES: GNAT family N-acetyltransferase [unclassified Streptomyces]|uniref:GNAT family N-acetyltransferase n=1 Tax=unclassified Streptomyces TaxID=2593676 RepID=UPI001661669E|nr:MULTISPECIES: GNAT family N-acetyltransferase [unclassified Streptomyces]MBD0708216.1 GNAT family N-acetyltransferase [Streptomyces sp. CBMA291]MBD0717785.1 GNAT family N-acetyltransferase [Streptomyces sp. CBMA370]